MKRDFTLKIYIELLQSLLQHGYQFITFEEFMAGELPSDAKVVILRHDVDARKLNSLEFARIQATFGIKGTYFFRMVPASFSIPVIKKVKILGHEIGYHYEDINKALKEVKHQNRNLMQFEEALIDKAWELFKAHLAILRDLYPIRTISMHGSPLSKYDNKLVWKKYNYRDEGIIGEPYYDIDFNDMAYFTDTGRRWNGLKVSVRDKVHSRYKFDYKSTNQIINSISSLPDKVMFTFHPQRWTDNPLLWTQEFILQNIKNLIKRLYTTPETDEP